MNISSRTPEGEPHRCPVCLNSLRIEPSLTDDGVCPVCGHLLWFPQVDRAAISVRGERIKRIEPAINAGEVESSEVPEHSLDRLLTEAGTKERPLLDCRDVVKESKGRQIVGANWLHVDQNEIVAILAPNHSGKTALLEAICGLDHSTSGTVHFDGTDVTTWPLHQRARLKLSWIPRDFNVFCRLTVEQNLRAVLQYGKLSKSNMALRINALLSWSDLEVHRDELSIRLASGAQRRLQFARALALRPGLIVADEPFTGIDPVGIRQIKDMILQLPCWGTSVLFADHQEESAEIASRVYCIANRNVVLLPPMAV